MVRKSLFLQVNLAVLLVALLAVSGCKKKATDTPPPAPTEPKAQADPKAPAEPAPTGEPKSEDKGPAPAKLMLEKGLAGVILPGENDSVDVVVGGNINELAGEAGIEIGEHGTKVDKPIGFTLGGHEFTGDGKGKIKRIRFALADVKQGVDVEGTTLPATMTLEEIKKTLADCGELKPLEGATHLSCIGGKVLFVADGKQAVFVQFGE